MTLNKIKISKFIIHIWFVAKILILKKIGEHALHCHQPKPEQLPLADVDFAPLFRAFAADKMREMLYYVLTSSGVRLIFIADDVFDLFQIIQALKILCYPFKCADIENCIVPVSYEWNRKSFSYILGILRRHIPESVSVLNS